MKPGIAKKLLVFFVFFILIFLGTVFDLFLKVQAMSTTSTRIVDINNKVAALSKNLRDNLIDMDANIKKFRLLKKEVYFDYFETARNAYADDLNRIILLERHSGGLSDSLERWLDIRKVYQDHTLSRTIKEASARNAAWPEDDRISKWVGDIALARKSNEKQIEQALIRIDDLSRQVVRNAAVGFGLSIFTGVLGIIFITRSVIRPLEKLKSGLKQVSQDNYTHEISVRAADEFGELAYTFNEMTRRLKADEEIRSDFIATLSHEIRTPLSSIRESVNMIVEQVLGPVNKKQKKFLKIAGDEISRITSLLNHLLDTSMLRAGEEELKPVAIDPNHLTEVAVQRFLPVADSRGIALKRIVTAPNLFVVGEEKKIMQVLVNLLDNALKFCPQKGEVVVSLEKGPGKDFLTFLISDSGPGIPPEKQVLIFQKYYRAQEVRRHMDGVGLGLNIARRIILAHGGEIYVHNNKEKGCTFSFTLPIAKTL